MLSVKFCARCRQPAGQATTTHQEPSSEVDAQSAGSFNNSSVDASAAEAERSAQSQVSSQAVADEELMAVAEERLMQAEQRALRAEEATQVRAFLGAHACTCMQINIGALLRVRLLITTSHTAYVQHAKQHHTGKVAIVSCLR